MIEKTTLMLRIILSSGKQQQLSRWQRLLSLLWLIGACLVITTYIVIPVLILSQQLHLLFDVILTALALTLTELIVSAILWKTGHPQKIVPALSSPVRQASWQDLSLLPTTPLPPLVRPVLSLRSKTPFPAAHLRPTLPIESL